MNGRRLQSAVIEARQSVSLSPGRSHSKTGDAAAAPKGFFRGRSARVKWLASAVRGTSVPFGYATSGRGRLRSVQISVLAGVSSADGVKTNRPSALEEQLGLDYKL